MTAVRLIAFSVPALDAEDRTAAALCEVLGVAAPPEWPPLFNDAGVRRWFREQLVANPAAADWLGYYIVADIGGAETLVGTGGYKGPPDGEATVEIGYSIIVPYHRRGIGSATVGQLVERAFADPLVTRVTAETPVTFTASRGLLEKCGFGLAGQRTDPEDGELALYSIGRPRT